VISGRWPWKLESAKECVTTHPDECGSLENGWRSSIVPMVNRLLSTTSMFNRVGGRGNRAEARVVRPGQAIVSADLGVISKYPGEIPGGR